MSWLEYKVERDEHDYAGVGGTARKISYADAIREALVQAMTDDKSVFVMGQGVDDPSGMFGVTRGLHLRFGRERVFDTPLAETALTGIAAGAAIGGMRPVYFHNRPDFLYLAMDQLVNHASKWHYMFGGAINVPMVVWACIGRGWGSAAQHSQALQGLFMHVPGLKLVMPGTCYDAKGLMLSAIADGNPVLVMEHRFNFKMKGFAPEHAYRIPFGKAAVRKRGKDVTLVAISHMATEAFEAAQELAREGIDAEVLDLRTLRPLDTDAIVKSVRKTGRAVVADTGWLTGGVTAEISALIGQGAFGRLRAPVARVACPDTPTPAGYTLEAAFYAGKKDIVKAARNVMKYGKIR